MTAARITCTRVDRKAARVTWTLDRRRRVKSSRDVRGADVKTSLNHAQLNDRRLVCHAPDDAR